MRTALSVGLTDSVMPASEGLFYAEIDDFAAQTCALNLRGVSGASVTFHWGDGSSDICALLGGDTDVVAQHSYAANGSYAIRVVGDIAAVTRLYVVTSAGFDNKIGIELSHGLTPFRSLETLYLYYSRGDLTAALSSLAALTSLRIGDGAQVSCDISGLDLTGFVQFGCLYNANQITGSLAALSNGVLQELYLDDATGVTGDLALLAGCNSLKYAQLSSTAVSGSLASIADKAALRRLHLDGTAIDAAPASGDIDWDSNIALRLPSAFPQEAMESLLALLQNELPRWDSPSLTVSGLSYGYDDLSTAAQSAYDALETSWTFTGI